MRVILTVITWAASVSCQFRAFPLYLPNHLHRPRYDPCKPLTPHCAFAMHGGHYGPRSYDGIASLGIPPYTMYLETIEHAVYLVKNYITTYKKPDKNIFEEEELQGSVSSQPLTQYVTVLTAVQDLIVQVAQHGAEFYPQFYQLTVLKTLRDVSNNPVQATGRLWARMDHLLEQISQITTLIKHKQETKCEEPNSTECDIVIHFALDQSSDQVLIRQADLLAAGGKEMEIFMNMVILFENAAYYRQSEDFLSNSAEFIEPLVMAGFETRKVLEAIASLQVPQTHLYVKKRKFSVEEILEQFASLRSNEEENKAAQATENPSTDKKADAQIIGSKNVVKPDEYNDYLVNSIENHYDLNDPVEKQNREVQRAVKHDNEVEPAEKNDKTFEKVDNNDYKLQLIENLIESNISTHIVTQKEPKVSPKYFKPQIIINYN